MHNEKVLKPNQHWFERETKRQRGLPCLQHKGPTCKEEVANTSTHIIVIMGCCASVSEGTAAVQTGIQSVAVSGAGAGIVAGGALAGLAVAGPVGAVVGGVIAAAGARTVAKKVGVPQGILTDAWRMLVSSEGTPPRYNLRAPRCRHRSSWRRRLVRGRAIGVGGRGESSYDRVPL